MRAATRFLRSHGSALPGGGPRTATQLAVLAVEVHDAFLGRDEDPEPGAVAVAVRAARGGGGRP